MPFYRYTEQELKTYTEKQLRRLCVYYDIEVFKSWSKDRLIKAILEYIPPASQPFEPEYVPAKVATKSARVARIEARMKGHEDD